MTDHTNNYSLPYPEGGDRVAVHSDIEALAKHADTQIRSVEQAANNTSQQVTSLSGTVTNHDTRISTAESAITKAGTDIDNLGNEVSEHGHKLEPIDRADDKTFRVRDQHGRVGLGVDQRGDVHIGATQHRESDVPYRVMDQHGAIALEVDSQGRTHIYDPAMGEGSAELTTLHVFVAAGQSNMSGRGRPIEGPQSPRVLQYGANRRALEQAPLILDMVDTPSGTSPATFFAHHYLATQPNDVGVLLIPAARGGTMFRGSPEDPSDTWTWTKDAAASPDHALYERSVDQTLEAIDAAQSAGYHVIVKGVLWHQGEGNGGMATELYAARLDALIQDYRTDLDHPTLPFMVGQQSPEGFIANPSKLTVDAAHQDTPYRVPFTGFAPSTWDGHNEGDTTHFSTVGTSHLGDTYMTAYVQALGNTSQQVSNQIEIDTSAGEKISAGGRVIKYDSGWRDVTAEASATVLSGKILVRRTLDAVQVSLDNIIVEESGTSTIFRLAAGFRPGIKFQGYWNENVNRAPRADFIANSSGYVICYQIPDDTTTPINATFSVPFKTPGFPTSLPGIPD